MDLLYAILLGGCAPPIFIYFYIYIFISSLRCSAAILAGEMPRKAIWQAYQASLGPEMSSCSSLLSSSWLSEFVRLSLPALLTEKFGERDFVQMLDPGKKRVSTTI